MVEPSGHRVVSGCLMLVLGLALVGVGAMLPPLTALAIHAMATLATLVQSLLQRRFGPRFGLPGLGALPIATAFGCSMALVPPLDAALWWPVAAALALMAGLLLVAPSLWLGERFGLREPLLSTPASGDEPLGPSPHAERQAWRPLGRTGLQVCTDEYGERGMGGPPWVAHRLSVGLRLPGEETGLSADERWWVVSGPWEQAIVALDLRERVMFSAPRASASMADLLSGRITEGRLARLGFERVRAYDLRDDGLWWPEGEPVPPTEHAFGPASAGLRRIALVDRQRLLDAGDAFAYARQPQWCIEGPGGPLPLQLAHGDIDDVVWQADGGAALIPANRALDGAAAPTRWYLWQAHGEGRWIDFGSGWGVGVLGAGTAWPESLQGAHVDVAMVIGIPEGAFPAMSVTSTLDGVFRMGTLSWFRDVDADGWPHYDEVETRVVLRQRRALGAAADSANAPLHARHPSSDKVLVFEPMGPPVDPREERPYRLCHERVGLDGISPVVRWMDDAGRFVVVQSVVGRALAPTLHLVDLDSGQIAILHRDVAELRVQAAHEGQLQWIELLGQRPIDAPPDPLQPLELVRGRNAWNRREALQGRFLALRGRRARLDAEAGTLVLQPPWTETTEPMSPLHPGDVLYRPSMAPPVLLLGAHAGFQDAWPREQEPRLGGRLLTAEGHVLADVAQGMVASNDGRWLLFARRPAERSRDSAWEVALLDRPGNVLHARNGVHFGGLPFLRAFDGDRIVFEAVDEAWWRPGMPRTAQVWSLAALLSRLDACPLQHANGLWQVPGDPTPGPRWATLFAAWCSGKLAE